MTFKKGYTPWNKGLTKENNKIIKNISKKLFGRTNWRKGTANIELICNGCGRKFIHLKCYSHQKYCSKTCYLKNISGENNPMHGKKVNEKQKRKHSEFMKGKPAWNKGIPNPSIKGENNPNWNGGTSLINDQLRKSIEWKQWRKKIFERDNYECQFCHQYNREIHPHHIKKREFHLELIFEVDNGITLCKPCHSKTHRVEHKFELICDWILETKKNIVEVG